MTRALHARLKALESLLSPCRELLTIVCRVVCPGDRQAEIQVLHDKKGKTWQRQSDETEHAFVERVKAEAWRNELGVMVLIGVQLC